MNFIDLDFERARLSHLLFKTNLRSILFGAESASDLTLSPQDSSFGKWLYEHALNAYSDQSEINEIERLHLEIHEIAADIITLYKNGEIVKVKESLAHVESLSADLLSMLDQLEKRVFLQNCNEKDAAPCTGNRDEIRELNRVLHDLDERVGRQAEISLRTNKQTEAAEARFRNVMMQAPVGIAILRGEDMMVEMVNEAYLEVVDRTEDQMLGHSLYVSLPEVEESVGPILTNVLKTGEAYQGNEFEVPIVRFGVKEQGYFNFVYQPLYENEKDITGIVVVVTEVTAQVRSRTALQNSELQFRNMVTQSQFSKAIFIGEDLTISIANEALLKIWRRSLEEVQGKKLLDVFPELVDQKFPEILRQVYRTGETYRENEAVAYVDGPGGRKRHYLDFQYAPMYELDGKVSGILVSINDVTEKVDARQEISDAVERLSLATEGTRLATWDLDLVTMQIIHSARLAQIFGYSDTTALNHLEFRDHVHPYDREHIVEVAFKKALATGTYFYEARIFQKSGILRWVRTQGKVFYNDEEQPVRMLGTMIDITEQKEAELALRTSEDKFRTLADSMPQFVWTGDAHGNLNYFNASVYNYCGLTPEDLSNGGWLNIVHPEDRHENMVRWTQAIQHGDDFLIEHRFRRSDGEYRWQMSRAIPQRDENGQIRMWVGTSTDIHDSKLFIDALELKVAQRTRQLTVSNDELIRTNMELAQFAYVASHDLQEPLRKIQTFASRIEETEVQNLSPRGKEYFQRMQASSIRMQQLITDLLAFSRANSVEKHYELADLNLVFSNIKEQLNELITQKGAVINCEELPVLNVIEYQFEQLFSNLIANALKFTKPGVSPIITITSGEISGASKAQLDPETKYCYISVADNGIGFESEYAERIFQVFQRLHNRTEYEGTGIGLAICKKIVENHHGVIEAVGVPGTGAVFTVYLPVR